LLDGAGMKRFVLLFVLLQAASAGAGRATVTLDPAHRTASGRATVGAEAEGGPSIGCSVTGGEFPVTCYAVSGRQEVASCLSDDPAFLVEARRVGPHSLIRFQWDASGACTRVEVTPYGQG
jgi:hypothetical protein